MSKYKIWDKKEKIITPIGEVLSAEDWIGRYPVAALENVDIVCSNGIINGGIFAVYDDFVDMYKNMGCDFSDCTEKQEFLDRISDFEDERNSVVVISAEERIASALEFQNMMSLPDVE